MTAATKKLKAYRVTDGGDGDCITFTTNNATARREGADELGIVWQEVDSCRRMQQFDQYAPGPVPAAALIADGWGFECINVYCQNWVHDDVEEKCFSASGDPYCCPACMAKHFARQRGTAAAQAALQEMVELNLPGCTVTEAYVYGRRLEPGEPGCGMRAYADFTFPGGRYPARFVFGEDCYRVHGDDIPAFEAWRGITPPAGEGTA
jgi:hypothetical protein